MPLLPRSGVRPKIRELFGTPGIMEVVGVAVVVIAAEVVAVGIITGLFSSHESAGPQHAAAALSAHAQVHRPSSHHHARARQAEASAAVKIADVTPAPAAQPAPTQAPAPAAPTQTQTQPTPQPVSDPAPTTRLRRHHHHFGSHHQTSPVRAPESGPRQNQDDQGGPQGDDGGHGEGSGDGGD